MTQTAQEAIATLDPAEVLARETFDVGELFRLRKSVYAQGKPREDLRNLVDATKAGFTSLRNADSRKSAARTAGIGLWILGKPDEAIEYLKEAGTEPPSLYVLGRCHLEMGEHDLAEQVLAQAKDGTEDNRFALFGRLEAQIEAGRHEAAIEELRRLKSTYDPVGEYHYLVGRACEMQRDYERALEAYMSAVQNDPEHPRALFRLGLVCDLTGEDARALEAYETLRRLNPTFVNAMLNLGILYEDAGRFEEAIDCFREVLENDPSHERARLFLKDAVASTQMYYDEDLKKEAEARREMLQTPIGEFELSVRSRKCLDNMGVRTLGDLVEKSQDELLQFKNFGDTSLREIQDLLAQRGLTLGQKVETELPSWHDLLHGAKPEDEQFKAPVSTLNLSVRARRCLSRLKVYTVGELVGMTPSDLLNAKNFGRTSLKEIESRLGEIGLALRKEG